MGILFIDGFSHYTSPAQKYTDMYGTLTINASYGRYSTAGIRNNQHGSYVSRDLSGTKTTLYLGVAIDPITLPFGATDKTIYQFRSGSGAQCTLTIGNDGKLRFYRGPGLNDAGTLIAGPTSVALSAGAWRFVELKVVFSNTIGECEIKIDGTLDVDASGLDTCAQTEEHCTVISCFGGYQYYGNPSADIYYDDFWLADDGYYGDCRVETRYPNGAGYYTEWSASAGSNWECINETPPDTGDYVYGTTAGTDDTYTKAALTTTGGDIKAVAANIYCRKSSAGTKTMAGLARLSSTDQAGSTFSVPSSWGYTQNFLTRPGGGTWTIADVNSAEMGLTIVS